MGGNIKRSHPFRMFNLWQWHLTLDWWQNCEQLNLQPKYGQNLNFQLKPKLANKQIFYITWLQVYRRTQNFYTCGRNSRVVARISVNEILYHPYILFNIVIEVLSQTFHYAEGKGDWSNYIIGDTKSTYHISSSQMIDLLSCALHGPTGSRSIQ